MKKSICLAGFTALIFAACAKPPIVEINDAQAAVNAAVQAGAEDYAADQLRLAQESLTNANGQIETKDYKGAKASALDAKAKADAAAASVSVNRAKAKTDAEAKVVTLRAATADVEKLLGHSKVREAAAINRDLGDLRTHLDLMQADIEKGNFKSALERGAMEDSLLAELKDRTEKAMAKKGPKHSPKKR